MADVLEKHLAAALDRRWAVFEGKARDGSLETEEMELRAAAYVASEIIFPCCCMLCNKAKLTALFRRTRLCAGRESLSARLAQLVYDDLARCNGLG